MRKKFIFLVFLTLALVSACSKSWQEHYEDIASPVNMSIWDALQDSSDIITLF